MNKKRLKNSIILIIMLISFITFCISIYNIIKYRIDEKNIKKQLEIITENVIVEEIDDYEELGSEETNEEIVEEIEEVKPNPYLDYTNMKLINVDINNLKKINSSVKGWIQVEGTNINYPFVQGKDNKYYLKHSFDKTYNKSGWVFLDYRNNIKNFNDKNIIIYAHNMKNEIMFGTLKNVLTSKWLKDSNNHIIKLSTESENTLWQVFSVYHIPTTSDYLKVNFSNDEEFIKFVNTLIKRSSYDFNIKVSENDKILTLSSCYSKTDRMVLHAKLIKIEKK